jgi:hypothetical protein
MVFPTFPSNLVFYTSSSLWWQVERLLRESCMGVLRGAKGLLLQALAQEGVTVDPVTLAASLTVAAAARGPLSSSSSGGGSGAGTGYVYSTLCTPSPLIFRKAEAVRCLLQEELNDLLRDIIVPVSWGEKFCFGLPAE